MVTPFLPQAAQIRSDAVIAEQLGNLTSSQLQVIYDQNWFNIFVPENYGGLGMDLPEAIRLQESLAWADGSFGWTVTLCSGANWFVGFLDKSVANIFFMHSKKVCFAGSGASTGSAEMVEGGFVVKGKWRYASGALHATAFTANCIVRQHGKVLKEKGGSEMIKTFLFDKSEVKILEDWNSLGMKATGSHSFEVDQQFVSHERTFTIGGAHAVLPDAIYQFPFLQFAEITLAANFSGMAMHFAEECSALFDERIRERGYSARQAGEMLDILGRMEDRIEGRRKSFHETVAQVWTSQMNNKVWNEDTLKELSKVCRELVKAALSAVDELYPYTGMTGADPGSVISRIWRDIHTASQHGLFTFGGMKAEKVPYSHA